MDNETSQMFTQLLAALQRKQALSDVEIKQLLTDAATRVESEPEREPIRTIRKRFFPTEETPW